MATHNVTLIPGDGIGPELSNATVRVVEATGVSINWDVQEAGEDVIAKYGTPLPEQVLASIRKNKVAIKGPISTPIGAGFRSVNVALRQELDLYSCLRPCKSYAGVKTRFDNVDFVIIRENTEDIYAGIEYEAGKPDTLDLIQFIKDTNGKSLTPDTGISIKPISEINTARIVRWAFEYARSHGRTRVTSVTKANIMKYTDGLWMRVAAKVAEGYPDIQYDEVLVDALCMQLVRIPETFDVLVFPNLYGDIVSDVGAGLIGGLGVAPGANFGNEMAVFEPTHGSAPPLKGLNKANPTAMMLSAVMMLQHLGEPDAAAKMERAITAVLNEGKDVTADLKPVPDDPTAASTSGYTDAVIAKM